MPLSDSALIAPKNVWQGRAHRPRHRKEMVGLYLGEKTSESGNPRGPFAKCRIGGDDEHSTDYELSNPEGDVDTALWQGNPHAPGPAGGPGGDCLHGGCVVLVLVTPGELAHSPGAPLAT
jgi:hypothetical protein